MPLKMKEKNINLLLIVLYLLCTMMSSVFFQGFYQVLFGFLKAIDIKGLCVLSYGIKNIKKEKPNPSLGYGSSFCS